MNNDPNATLLCSNTDYYLSRSSMYEKIYPLDIENAIKHPNNRTSS